MADDEKKTVLHIEIDSEGRLNALLPDNFCLALGMLDYARERLMEQIVRPSMRSRVALPSKLVV